MRLYLDDDSLDALMVRLLASATYEVQRPADAKLSGKEDPCHLIHAIRAGRTLLTHNHDDYKLLHELILVSGGHHPGIVVVRRDNDPTRDMQPKAIVRALGKLLASGIPIADELHILNHWR